MKPALVRARQVFTPASTRILCAVICTTLLAMPAKGPAQVVTPKTVPVLQSGQFEMHPSALAGMGGASIAVDDTLLDPFVNPAKATRMGASQVDADPLSH